MAYQFDQASSSTATSSGYHNLPAPCTVPVQAFLVNPSPHELAVGSVEQYRPSKLSKAWKNVVLSLVKSEQDTSLCVWRDTIQQDGSSQLQLIQHLPVSSLQYANKIDASYHDGSSEPGCRFSVMTTTMDELVFRCQGEPQACQSWVTTLQTVCDHVQQTSNYNYTPAKKKEIPPPADLLSFDEAPTSTANQTPDLLAAQNWQLNSHQNAPQIPNSNKNYPQQQQQQLPPNSQYYGQQNSNNPNQQQHGQRFNSNQNYQQPRHPHQQQSNHHPSHVRSLSPPPTHRMQQQRQFSNPPPLNPLRGAIPGMYGQAPINMATPTKPYPQQHPTNTMRSQTPPPRPPGSMPRATTVPFATPQQPAVSRPKPTQHHHPPHRSHSMPFPKDAANANTNNSHSQERIKQYVISNWAVYPPPALPQLKSLRELIRSVHTVLPPPNLVQTHPHFSKWKPPPSTLLTLQDQTRLTRKLKVVLHPDKLPQDFTADQTYLCKVVWDVLNDAQQQQQQQH